jgi:hypothetical protein
LDLVSAAANAYMKSFKAGRGGAGGGYELEKGELGDTSAGYSDQNENIRPVRRGDATLDTPNVGIRRFQGNENGRSTRRA